MFFRGGKNYTRWKSGREGVRVRVMDAWSLEIAPERPMKVGKKGEPRGIGSGTLLAGEYPLGTA